MTQENREARKKRFEKARRLVELEEEEEEATWLSAALVSDEDGDLLANTVL
jgi:hypothetical protein